jgi:hypothetical protein
MVPILGGGGGIASMGSILILLALSALLGFVLASYFSWPAILVAGAVLAPLSAFVLQNQGFGALSGISITVACLAINQAAYVVGRILMVRTTGLSRIIYFSNGPTTNHRTVATMTSAANTNSSRTINSSWPNSPIDGRLI